MFCRMGNYPWLTHLWSTSEKRCRRASSAFVDVVDVSMFTLACGTGTETPARPVNPNRPAFERGQPSTCMTVRRSGLDADG